MLSYGEYDELRFLIIVDTAVCFSPVSLPLLSFLPLPFLPSTPPPSFLPPIFLPIASLFLPSTPFLPPPVYPYIMARPCHLLILYYCTRNIICTNIFCVTKNWNSSDSQYKIRQLLCLKRREVPGTKLNSYATYCQTEINWFWNSPQTPTNGKVDLEKIPAEDLFWPRHRK